MLLITHSELKLTTKMGKTDGKPVKPSNQRKSEKHSTTSIKKGKSKNKPMKPHQKNPQFKYYEEQRLQRIREKDERKAKKEEKLLLRKKEKLRKVKILTKKNRKGQPVMGGRMELLLEKIKRNM